MSLISPSLTRLCHFAETPVWNYHPMGFALSINIFKSAATTKKIHFITKTNVLLILQKSNYDQHLV